MTEHTIPELDKKGLREFGLVTGGIVAGLFGLFFPWIFDRAFPEGVSGMAVDSLRRTWHMGARRARKFAARLSWLDEIRADAEPHYDADYHGPGLLFGGYAIRIGAKGFWQGCDGEESLKIW